MAFPHKHRLKHLGLFLVLLLTASGCSDMNLVIPGVNPQSIFEDEFVLGQTGSWRLESDEVGSTTIVPEQMLIEINAPDTVQYAVLNEPELTDFLLEVDGRILAGSPQSSYGVLFRIQGPREFYRFEITGDGTYILERHNSDGSRSLFTGDWRDSEAIVQGLNVVNRLGVRAEGPNISLYVNDVLLMEAIDDTYAGGAIALDAGTFSQSPGQFAFDNLVVSPPGS